MSEHDDTILHMNGLQELAQRAAAAHAASEEDELDYERWGVCTADLVVVARLYAINTAREVAAGGGSGIEAMVTQFLTGFDLGIQTRLEMESRTLAKADIFDRKDNV